MLSIKYRARPLSGTQTIRADQTHTSDRFRTSQIPQLTENTGRSGEFKLELILGQVYLRGTAEISLLSVTLAHFGASKVIFTAANSWPRAQGQGAAAISENSTVRVGTFSRVARLWILSAVGRPVRGGSSRQQNHGS